MRAILNSHIIAESDDIEIGTGYEYFPASSTRLLRWKDAASARPSISA
jgi:hypothetical protein